MRVTDEKGSIFHHNSIIESCFTHGEGIVLAIFSGLFSIVQRGL